MNNDSISIDFSNLIETLSKDNECIINQAGTAKLIDRKAVEEIVSILERIILPYCYAYKANSNSLEYLIGRDIYRASDLLAEQLLHAFRLTEDFFSSEGAMKNIECIVENLFNCLPIIKNKLQKDIHSAYYNDPAAKNYIEIFLCYPALKAILYHRIAHELYLSDVPLVPRLMNEIAHSVTGIDIHPGAEIGESFFIDHGTGLVIGETSIIGNNVKIYQGVTLGAKVMALDENGKPIKGIPRHPIIEDDVTIYPNTTILGRVTIGKGSIIGANLWITNDIDPFTKLNK
jgi:serine O-acetyltransferase